MLLFMLERDRYNVCHPRGNGSGNSGIIVAVGKRLVIVIDGNDAMAAFGPMLPAMLLRIVTYTSM